jgi:hypothetical protein
MDTSVREESASSAALSAADRGMTMISETGRVEGWPGGREVRLGGDDGVDGRFIIMRACPASGLGSRRGELKCGLQTTGAEVSRPVERDLLETVLDGAGPPAAAVVAAVHLYSGGSAWASAHTCSP